MTKCERRRWQQKQTAPDAVKHRGREGWLELEQLPVVAGHVESHHAQLQVQRARAVVELSVGMFSVSVPAVIVVEPNVHTPSALFDAPES